MVPPEPIGSVPQIAVVDQVTVQIHRHRRGRMPQHRLDDLGTPRRQTRSLASVRVWALPALLAIVTYGLVDRHRFAYPL